GDTSGSLVAQHSAQSAGSHAEGLPLVQRSCHPDRRAIPSQEVTVIRETSSMKRHTYPWAYCLFMLVMCLTVATPVHAFKITEQAEGAKLTAAATDTVNVALGKDSGIVQVRYYWYGEQDDTLVEQEDATATGSIVAPVVLIGLFEQNTTFGGPLLVPKDGIGPMRLLAVAEISRGRLGTRSVFDEILVQVEPTASLTTI